MDNINYILNLDDILSWAEKNEAYIAPKSAFGKAIIYTVEHSQYIKNFLFDGRLEISNNIAELSKTRMAQHHTG